MGAEAIRKLLSEIDLTKLQKDLRAELSKSQGAKRAK